MQLILAYPFAAWRTFLHPSQRKIAYRESYAGPAQVTGGPGTGKTVTVLHRAAFLAERAGRVLVTTFNGNLAGALRAQLDLLIRDAGVRRRIEVLNVDRLAYSIVKQFGQQVRSGAEPPGDDVPPRRFAHPPGEHLIVAPAEQRTQERPLDGLRVR